jgi:hypothetical protein
MGELKSGDASLQPQAASHAPEPAASATPTESAKAPQP